MVHFAAVRKFVVNDQFDQMLRVHGQMPRKIQIAVRVARAEAFSGPVDRELPVICIAYNAGLFQMQLDDSAGLPAVKIFQHNADRVRICSCGLERCAVKLYYAGRCAVYQLQRILFPQKKELTVDLKSELMGWGALIFNCQLLTFAPQPWSKLPEYTFQLQFGCRIRHEQFAAAVKVQFYAKIFPPGG